MSAKPASILEHTWSPIHNTLPFNQYIEKNVCTNFSDFNFFYHLLFLQLFKNIYIENRKLTVALINSTTIIIIIIKKTNTEKKNQLITRKRTHFSIGSSRITLSPKCMTCNITHSYQSTDISTNRNKLLTLTRYITI